jgi:hypothetical protein
MEGTGEYLRDGLTHVTSVSVPYTRLVRVPGGGASDVAQVRLLLLLLLQLLLHLKPHWLTGDEFEKQVEQFTSAQHHRAVGC